MKHGEETGRETEYESWRRERGRGMEGDERGRE